VNPQDAVIVVPAGANGAILEAAEELGKHLELVTGVAVATSVPDKAPAGGHAFHVGIRPAGDAKPFEPEEARWVVRREGTYLYGDDGRGRRGAQTAVYGFLEDQLGVRWVEPGDRGISCAKQSPLVLTIGSSGWAPTLESRNIRVGHRAGRGGGKVKPYMEEFRAYQISREQNDRLARDELQWRQRMRMGSHSDKMGYGHAFTSWWDEYHEAHPDYFALNKWGAREPELREDPKGKAVFSARDRQFVKVCPSNPKVVAQVIENWRPLKGRRKVVPVSQNDMSFGYCRCAGCRKLDVAEEGEKFGEHLSDRYVHLANAVAREALKHRPDAGAAMYAYSETEQPPRREKVDPNVLVAVVPTTVDCAKLRKLYSGWRAAGATALVVRPNYHHYYCTAVVPMGFEKQMFDAFQAAVEYGVIGADYDSLMCNWPVTGMTDYVLAKAMSDPSKPFEHWERHYCAAYGPAAEDVRSCFRHWREELWEKRLRPDLEKLLAKGKCHNFARGLMWSLGRYYTADDFDRTDALLRRAAERDLSESQRDKLDQLVLANRHARLIVNAASAEGMAKFKHADALLAFRAEHKDKLRLPWLGVFTQEIWQGDVTGVKAARTLRQYPLPWVQTDLVWRFKLDPEDVGLKRKWQELSWEQTADWDRMRTDSSWEPPYEGEPYPPLALEAQLRAYDGMAWYATQLQIPKRMRGRELILYFGAVDESCWVYVNGKPAGKHIFTNPADWKTPFEIRIDPCVDWDKAPQIVTVRVEDKAGAGGIWKRVWLVSRRGPAPAGQQGGVP